MLDKVQKHIVVMHLCTHAADGRAMFAWIDCRLFSHPQLQMCYIRQFCYIFIGRFGEATPRTCNFRLLFSLYIT